MGGACGGKARKHIAKTMRKVVWARRKYKTLSRHKRRSVEWLFRLKKDSPRLFLHWRVFESKVG